MEYLNKSIYILPESQTSIKAFDSYWTTDSVWLPGHEGNAARAAYSVSYGNMRTEIGRRVQKTKVVAWNNMSENGGIKKLKIR